MRCCHTSDWNSEGRATHVVEVSLVEEHDALRVSSGLTTDTNLEVLTIVRVCPALTPVSNRDLDETAYTVDIKVLERVVDHNWGFDLVDVLEQELPFDIVPTEGECCLGEA